MKIILIIIFFILLSNWIFAQENNYIDAFLEVSILYNSGKYIPSVGINITRTTIERNNNMPATYLVGLKLNYALFLNRFYFAPYVGYCVMVYYGLELPIIFNFREINIGLSPSAGIGFGAFNLFAKYNFFIISKNNDMELCFNVSPTWLSKTNIVAPF